MEGICYHCIKVKEVTEHGPYLLCSEDIGLKQYEQKDKKKKPIRARSVKRAKEEKKYLELNRKYLEKHPICQVCIDIDNPIKNRSDQVHHKGGRIGKLLTYVPFFLAVCKDHHEDIHNNFEWALEKKYIILRST